MNINFLAPIFGNFIESFVDNVFMNKVEPEVGSIIYCDLLFGYAEHSGVYIGDNQIIHLNKYGNVEIVDTFEFTFGTTAMSIYVSCCSKKPRGGEIIAERAKSMLGTSINYNFLANNCHQFTSGCITGDFNNFDNFLWMLKKTAKKYNSVDSWRVWDL